MRKLLGAVALVAMLAIPGAVNAQTIGGAIGFHDDFDFGIGAYGSIPVPQLHENLAINPSFVFYFPDGYDAWELNGDVVYSFPVSGETPVSPFALAGINIVHTSVSVLGISGSATDIGLNLGGGVVFPMESIRPMAGAKFEIQDGSGFLVFGGVGFPLG